MSATGPEAVPIDEWDRLCEAFTRFFAGLGRIRVSGERVSFTSPPHTVATGFSVDRSGHLAASMPLHGIEVRGSLLEFDPAGGTVTLVGPDVRYVYRVPPELREPAAD